MKKKIRVLKLLQGRLERPHKGLGEGTDETDRVGEDHLPLPWETEPAGRRIQGGEQQVSR
jgi:hypothetical protein